MDGDKAKNDGAKNDGAQDGEPEDRGAGDDRRGGDRSSFTIYREGGSTPEISLTVLMVLVARRWRALLDEHLRPLGQSAARMEAMSAIINSPAPSAQIEIANRLRIEGPTMTRMTDVLSRDNLVERQPAPHDRRTKYLRLTETGETALEEIFTVTDELRARLLEGLSKEDIARMQTLLAILLERLDAGLPAKQTGAAEV